MYWRIPYRVLEEKTLHRAGPHRLQARQKEQEAAEARGLPGKSRPDVVTKDTLRLILQHLHRVNVYQAAGVYR